MTNTETQNRPIVFKPKPGPQEQYFETLADEMLYAAAKGQGKSSCLLIDAAQYVHEPDYTAVILRRKVRELEMLLIPEARRYYEPIGGVYNKTEHTFTWKNGARIIFGFLDKESDLTDYQGFPQLHFLGFDELPHFHQHEYAYLKAGLRSSNPRIPVRIRASGNSGGIGHEWVFEYWKKWLDFGVDENGVIYEPAPLPSGAIARFGKRGRTRSCIVAMMGSNDAVGEDYAQQFESLDDVKKAQLLYNNWRIKPNTANFFKRHWFSITAGAPVASTRKVRAWDLAATSEETARLKNYGDYTVGILLSKQALGFTVEDMRRERLSPGGVEQLILNTARSDGRDVRIVLPIDPGQAAMDQQLKYTQLLAGFNVSFERMTRGSGSKATRAKPVSSACENYFKSGQSFQLVQGIWNDAFLAELEEFDENPKLYKHDDICDGFASAFNSMLANNVRFEDIDMGNQSMWTFNPNKI